MRKLFALILAVVALGLFADTAFAGRVSFNASRSQVGNACKAAGGTSWTVDNSYGCQTSKGHVECTQGKCTGWCETCGQRMVGRRPITTASGILTGQAARLAR
ncbi:MAG: hypothetical protein WDO17_25320 [Alphaproteobacteria bacterium]